MPNLKPSPILLLPSEVVDQIAAGEVVERPAHLVKELVENAIDAGATSIEIEYDQGGRRVRVTDDGWGMSPESLKLALSRHATSKIRSADDIWHLSSFGFRGEALASIAAVSRLTLQSRPRDAAGGASGPTLEAAKIVSEFGRLSEVEAASGNPGTTVLVEDLFANVPARLKFMKTEAGEAQQIKAALRALALANENVEFRVRTKGKLETIWPRAKSFVERAEQINADVKLYYAAGDYEGVKAEIAFAGPHDVTGNARAILVFVQRRWVQDRGLQAAVIDAFRGLLMHGELPVAVVRVDVPAEDVDVNIHPTKSQVKFRDPQAPFRAVNRSLRAAIELAPWLNEKADSHHVEGSPMPALSMTSGRKLSLAELTRKYNGSVSDTDASSVAPTAGRLDSAPIHSLGRFDAPEFNSVVFKKNHDPSESRDERIVGAVESFAARNAEGLVPDASVSATSAKVLGHWSRLHVIGQAHLTYIVAQDGDRLMLIDQHAAHERVAYERLMRAWKGGEIEIQNFLLPLQLDVDGDGAELLAKNAAELESLGVILDQVGPQAIAIRAKPALISDKALMEALIRLAHEMSDRGGSFELERKISDLCATMACHSVVRAGQSLSVEQMRQLLEQMDEFPLSSFCPHGRPVSIEFSFARLERDFGRTV